MIFKSSPLILAMFFLLTACGGGTDGHNVRPLKNAKKSSRINVELGVLYMRKGNNKNALARLKKAIVHDPENAKAYGTLGVLYARLKKYEKADENFRQAIQIAPKDSGIHNNYGAFLCKQKRYKEAQAQFDAALKNPLYATPEYVYLNAGVCSRDKNVAEKYLRAALQKKPKFPAALLQMAKLSLEKKRYLSARAYLQRYHAVVKPTPASLWLSIQVESVLGDRGTLYSHATLLKGKYPDSEETRLYLQWKGR